MRHTTIRLLLVLLFAGFSSLAMKAQLRFTFSTSGNPPAALSQWQDQKQLGVLTVIPNQSAPFKQCRIVMKLTLDGELAVQTDVKRARVQTLESGTVSTFFSEDIFPYNTLEVSGRNKTSIEKTGKLLAGTYQLCIRLTDAEGLRFISEEFCRPVTITGYQPPSLVLPANETEVDCNNRRILFKWTPVLPPPAQPVTYRVRIFEVLPGQTPVQAYRVNRPVVEKEVMGITQLLWPTDFDLPIPGRKYIWNVDALDGEGRPIGENAGKGEPYTFSITGGPGCGEAIIDPGNLKCNCGKWEQVSLLLQQPSEAAKGIKLTCGKTMEATCNKPYTIAFKYVCKPANCAPVYQVQVKDPTGNTQTFNTVNPNAFTYTFTMGGAYQVSIIPKCGEKVCEPCVLNFNVSCTEDCCKELIKEIKNTKPAINGSQLQIGAQFFLGMPVDKVDVTITSMQSTITCTKPGGASVVTNSSLPVNINTGSCSGLPVTQLPYAGNIMFSGGSSANPLVGLSLILPAPPSQVYCKEVITVCVRYTLSRTVEGRCISCEIVRCYTISRSGGIQ
jgi:hypothetical protein